MGESAAVKGLRPLRGAKAPLTLQYLGVQVSIVHPGSAPPLIVCEKVAGSTRTPLRFTVEGQLLKLNAQSSVGVSYDEVECEHEGDDIVISFNNRNLIDSVRSCSGERVRIEMSTPLFSINIIPVDPGEGNEDLFFMMPVRTKS